MARTRTRTVEAPPRNDRYVVMIGLIALCMLVGCVVMYLDLSDYSDSEAKGGPTISIPKIERGIGPPRTGEPTPPPPAP